MKADTFARDHLQPRELWQVMRYDTLPERLKLRGHDQETLHELRETALRYGILSEYTSYLVQEPGMNANFE